MNIGNSVQIALQKKGKTQVWLAGELGCSRQRVNEITKRSVVNATTLSRLADALEMSIDYLISLDAKDQKP